MRSGSPVDRSGLMTSQLWPRSRVRKISWQPKYAELSNQSIASGGDHWQRYLSPTGSLSSVCHHGLTERRALLISSNVATCAA